MMHFWFNYIPFVSNNVLPTPEITAKKKIFPRISLQSILFFFTKLYQNLIVKKFTWKYFELYDIVCTVHGTACTVRYVFFLNTFFSWCSIFYTKNDTQRHAQVLYNIIFSPRAKTFYWHELLSKTGSEFLRI